MGGSQSRKNANSTYFWAKNGIFSNFDGALGKKCSVNIYKIFNFYYIMLQLNNSDNLF